jgi:cyclopropane fatty-acyl-phospholipid synthase-like methyltransferase
MSSRLLRSAPTDYRARFYERYVTEQMTTDVTGLRRALSDGMPYYRRLVERHLPRNTDARIFDVGCGYGPLLFALSQSGYSNLSGIDASPEQVRVATELGLGCVSQGDVLDALTNAAAESYDAVAAIDVLEHFTKDEIVVFLDQAYRVLRRGGTLLLHVPNGEAIFAGKIFFGDFTHQTAFTHRSIRQVALACGFTAIRCYEDSPIPHGIVSTIRAFLWWLVRCNYRLINGIETGDIGRELILSQNLLAVCLK